MIHGGDIIFDWSETLKTLFDNKKPKSKNNTFKIQSYSRLQYCTTGTILASKSYQLSYQPFTFGKKSIHGIDLTLNTTPPVKLKPQKEKDVRSLFCYLNDSQKNWFEEVLSKSHGQ